MGGEVLVSLLVTRVLGDEVEVLAADDERAVHLGRDDGACQNATADGDEASEGAFLVYAFVLVEFFTVSDLTAPSSNVLRKIPPSSEVM